MCKAVFIDFYGTIVYEDGVIVRKIVKKIFETGAVNDISDIGGYWWNEFQASFLEAYGDNFKTQRELEYQSIVKTVEHFQSSADAVRFSNMMFEQWVKPPIFPESKEFFEKCPIPVYIVSNIDRADIMKAIEFHGLKPAGVFTSEDARSYKPRQELFEYALNATGLKPEQVVHIGDSLSSDIKGATSVGIDAVWINRSARQVPIGVMSIGNLLELFDTKYFKQKM